MREELMGKKLGSVYKRHIGNDFRFEMMITERIALSFFVRQWRPLDPPRGVGSRVCMQRNVHAYARDARFVLTYTCSQVYIGCERLDQQNGFSFVRQWTCNHVTTGSVCPLVHFILIAWIGRFLTLPLEIAFFSPPFLCVSTPL